jgi:hypothetical protein
MLSFQHSQSPLRRHLTLIELIVVLTILVALGGIGLSLAPELLGRTHVAVAVTNLPEINKVLFTYTTLTNGQIPNLPDSLIDGTTGTLYSALPNTSEFTASSITSIAAGFAGFDGAELLSTFQDKGLLSVVDMDNTAPNKTFDVGSPELLTSASVLALVSGTTVGKIFNIDPTGKVFLAFGLGKNCSLIGDSSDGGLSEAPIHFTDEPNAAPQVAYARYVMIYSLSENADGEPEIKLLGASTIHDDGLLGVEGHLREWYGQ